ncbi:MAG: hypothetical protein LBE18_07880 [Planctomycetaceae bacterium]|jgi:spore maturation protein SpmA|nr:hypothetical protein [Planctomycetaceae bacterium]
MTKEQKIFSATGQIFIVILLGIMTAIPHVISHFRVSTSNGSPYDTLYNTYLDTVCGLNAGLFILYSVTLIFLNYYEYKVDELSLYLALLLFVLTWLSL